MSAGLPVHRVSTEKCQQTAVSLDIYTFQLKTYLNIGTSSFRPRSEQKSLRHNVRCTDLQTTTVCKDEEKSVRRRLPPGGGM